MPTYIGFSTLQLDQVRKTNIASGADGGSGSITNPVVLNKKFRMVDTELVLQDFLNSLNIPQGSKPGRPDYGTTLWDFVFEPNTTDLQVAVESEIKRMANLDPRLLVNSVVVYPYENGVLIEVEIAVSPFNFVQTLAINFDQQTGRASPAGTGGASMLMPGVSR
jgi:phage baseplate assembly protein W